MKATISKMNMARKRLRDSRNGNKWLETFQNRYGDSFLGYPSSGGNISFTVILTSTPTIYSGISYTTTCTLNMSGLVNAARLINTVSPFNTISLNTTPALPQTASSFNFNPITTFIIGIYQLELQDNFLTWISAPTQINCVYTISSFTPTNWVDNTTITGISITFSASGVSIASPFSASFKGVALATTYVLTAASVSGFVVSFNNYIGGFVVDTYDLTVDDVNGNTLFTLQQLNIYTSFAVTLTSTPTIYSGISYTTTCTLNMPGLVNAARLINTVSPFNIIPLNTTPALPQTASSFNFDPITTFIIGIYQLELQDNFLTWISAPTQINCVYTISSFTPTNWVDNTTITGISITFSASGVSIASPFSASFKGVALATTYVLTAASVSGFVVSFNNYIGGFVADTYDLTVDDVNGNTLFTLQQLIIYNSFTVTLTSAATTDNVTPYTTLCTLSNSSLVTQAELENTVSPFNTIVLSNTPALPIVAGSFTFNPVTISTVGTYRLRLMDASGNWVLSSSNINCIYTITSFTPTNNVTGNPLTVAATLSSSNTTISSGMWKDTSSVTTYNLTNGFPITTPGSVVNNLTIASLPVGTYNLQLFDISGTLITSFTVLNVVISNIGFNIPSLSRTINNVSSVFEFDLVGYGPPNFSSLTLPIPYTFSINIVITSLAGAMGISFYNSQPSVDGGATTWPYVGTNTFGRSGVSFTYGGPGTSATYFGSGGLWAGDGSRILTITNSGTYTFRYDGTNLSYGVGTSISALTSINTSAAWGISSLNHIWFAAAGTANYTATFVSYTP